MVLTCRSSTTVFPIFEARGLYFRFGKKVRKGFYSREGFYFSFSVHVLQDVLCYTKHARVLFDFFSPSSNHENSLFISRFLYTKELSFYFSLRVITVFPIFKALPLLQALCIFGPRVKNKSPTSNRSPTHTLTAVA